MNTTFNAFLILWFSDDSFAFLSLYRFQNIVKIYKFLSQKI